MDFDEHGSETDVDQLRGGYDDDNDDDDNSTCEQTPIHTPTKPQSACTQSTPIIA